MNVTRAQVAFTAGLIILAATASAAVGGTAGRVLALLPFVVLAAHAYWSTVPGGLKS